MWEIHVLMTPVASKTRGMALHSTLHTQETVVAVFPFCHFFWTYFCAAFMQSLTLKVLFGGNGGLYYDVNV